MIAGSVHDLDNHDAVIPGATLSIGQRTTLTDSNGTFTFEDLTQPAGSIDVYTGIATAKGTLPACADKLVWIGVHTHDVAYERTALVIRLENRSVDLAALKVASDQREALAGKWLAFYEGLASIVEGSHANCADMATALEKFVQESRGAIDAINREQAAMTSHERAQLRDTLEQKFGSRTAAVQEKVKGASACQTEPRVRRALDDIPR